MAYADSVTDLEILMKQYSDATPSLFLRDDGLAAYYYDGFSLRELRSFFQGDPDKTLCERFQLSAGEWRDALEMAIVARTGNRRRKAEKESGR
ncbi:hypothetical protein OOT00_02230 [Desulfobotulus sp. H1]|uniref:Uncharacterized protein n=1 Tax=Desulfobotulus pelophilus TaxID=2823377 RepID=A0ABT3N5R1_9BACT|nr:hypothetical protein [Desulfobotulus pelophilus]MCW7752801.1 hypothetical protein [Desulfobotulus pelophilus]